MFRHIFICHLRKFCFDRSFLTNSIFLRSFAPLPLQKLHYYYERSDSCLVWFFVLYAMNSSPNSKQVSSFNACCLRVIPTPTTHWISHTALIPLISVCDYFRASPLARRLTNPIRRNVFVILRTNLLPHVALHPASRRRSYARLQPVRVKLKRTCTSLTTCAQERTNSDL